MEAKGGVPSAPAYIGITDLTEGRKAMRKERQISIFLDDDNAVMPTLCQDSNSKYLLHANSQVTLPPGERAVIHTGVDVSLPAGMRARVSGGLLNAPGARHVPHPPLAARAQLPHEAALATRATTPR